ncbi:MAG: DUF4835 family protein [Prevotellaceae bacterium]|jgi:hypothetical protein|nr:DUF4835 family protein [Prevotellaceae bacterium]
MKKTTLILAFFCISLFAVGQELNCSVTVNAEKLTTATNKQIFNTLQKAIGEFVNNRRWTDLQYEAAERIECSFFITINEAFDEKDFKASIQVQSRRPIFNSSYYTPLFSFKDDNFNFEYIEHTPIEYAEGSFSSNLSAVLAYYCYLIIGYDADSFARLGGTSAFSKAESIVNLAQSQNEKGWKAFEDDRNRYAIINNLLDNNLRQFREFFYTYHRLGLDEMAANVSKGSAQIANSFSALREANRARPSSVVLSIFLDSKRDEIVNIFSKAPAKEKKQIYDLLMDIDPSKSAVYDQIMKN